MDAILVAVFANCGEAREGSRILRDLDAAGCIDVFAVSLVAMRDGGDAAVLDAPDAGPLGTAVRLFTDRLLLTLARPQGTATMPAAPPPCGPPDDPARPGVGEQVVAEVTRHLRPGGAVLVAEIWERWVQPVNARLAALGAVVLRRRREDVVVADIERERAALEAERENLERRHAGAANGERAALERRRGDLEDGIRAVRDRARAALAAARAEHDAKMAVLLAKRAAARDPDKPGLDARISERLAQHRHRTMALMRAAT
jgi:hypothetical protein